MHKRVMTGRHGKKNSARIEDVRELGPSPIGHVFVQGMLHALKVGEYGKMIVYVIFLRINHAIIYF